MILYEKRLYNRFFKQFEELNYKLDSLLEENKTIKLEHKKELNKISKDFKTEISSLNDTIKDLNTKLDDANKMIEKLKNDNDRLRNQNNKNSSNSSKPSSTDSFKPKRTGANIYNYRIKTNRKPGAQLGHKGNHLSKDKIEKLIKDKKVEVITIEHVIKGNSKKENKVDY